jgi:oxalate decarboxylase
MSDNTAPEPMCEALSRRRLLGATTVALAAGALADHRAVAQSPANVSAAERNASATNLGPENQVMRSINPDGFLPPPTDHGSVPNFWNSFSASHRRIQEGGWTRQVNVVDFPISKELAGVNMKLNAGGIRELHWHAADEWALMLAGNCRLTAIDFDGKSYVQDVAAGDLWYFPTGIPHSLEGLGPDGCEFLLVFNDASFSEDDTTLLSDWLIHTPRGVLAKNWGVPQSALAPLDNIPLDGRYIFQAPVPGSLEADRLAAARGGQPTSQRFHFHMMQMAPTKSTRSGEARIVDSRNFPMAAKIAAAHVTIKPGGMRELHWHPNADEWQYYIKGKGRMTLFFNKAAARTADFNPGDVGYAPRTLGHYVENTGDEDLVFLALFRSPVYQDFSLNEWLTHLPPELVTQHLGISTQTLDMIPRSNFAILPA